MRTCGKSEDPTPGRTSGRSRRRYWYPRGQTRSVRRNRELSECRADTAFEEQAGLAWVPQQHDRRGPGLGNGGVFAAKSKTVVEQREELEADQHILRDHSSNAEIACGTRRAN